MTPAQSDQPNRSQPPLEALPLDGSSFGGTLAGWLFTAYLLLGLIGYIGFRSPGAMVGGNEMSDERALFTSMNAVTLTGFQQTVSVNQYLLPGQVMAFILTLGGALLSLIIGGLAVVRILRLPYSDGKVVVAAVVWLGVATMGGAALLIRPGQDLFSLLMQAASAFSNSGVYIGQLSGIMDWRQTHVVLLPLAVLGGLGLPVLMELYDWALRRKRVSLHGRTVLAMTAGLYLGGFVVFALLQWPGFSFNTASETWLAWQHDLASSSAAAINARTAGLPFEHAYLFPRAMQWVLIVLMMIGSSSAGTGGGLKTTTVAELVRGPWLALRGQRVGRGFGIAAAWLGIYLLIGFVCLLLLLWAQPQMPADRLLFITISAVSNVGMSHDPVSITGFGMDVLSATMLAGRLAPLLGAVVDGIDDIVCGSGGGVTLLDDADGQQQIRVDALLAGGDGETHIGCGRRHRRI